MRSSAANNSPCSTEGGLRSTSHRQVPKLAVNVSDLKRGSSKRKKEKGNTFRRMKKMKGQFKFSRIGGVEILPGPFLSILNKYGGIER